VREPSGVSGSLGLPAAEPPRSARNTYEGMGGQSAQVEAVRCLCTAGASRRGSRCACDRGRQPCGTPSPA
jgi:hypothetical protein